MGSSANKTEKPTPKRIEDARKEGQVARSNDLNGAIVLGTATGLMVFVGPYTGENIRGILQYTLSDLLLQSVTPKGFEALIGSTIENIVWLVIPFFLGILVMGVLGNLVQIKPLFSPKAIQPKMDKVNPVNGFKRLWSMRAVVEVVKALLKMGVVGGISTAVIWANWNALLGLGYVQPITAVSVINGVIGQIALYSVVIFFVVGLADFLYQKYELEKQLMMTKQEIKDERKNMEGDPAIKRKIREVGLQLSRKRQLHDVKTADVVITNPTHISVAIKYDPDVSPAPMVVAKGQEHFALKLREVAKENGVTVIENKPVARALYKVVEVGHMIPPELFVAVAEILAKVFSKRRGRQLSAKR